MRYRVAVSTWFILHYDSVNKCCLCGCVCVCTCAVNRYFALLPLAGPTRLIVFRWEVERWVVLKIHSSASQTRYMLEKKKQNDESTVLTKRSSFGWTISISMPIFECFVSAPVPRVNVRFFRGAIPSTAAGRSSRGQHAQIQLICVRQCRQISVGGVFVTAFIGWTHTHTLLPSHSRRLIGLIRVIN